MCILFKRIRKRIWKTRKVASVYQNIASVVTVKEFSIPDFVRHETPGLQEIVEMIYTIKSTRAEFLDAMSAIGPSFKDSRRFLEWLNRERAQIRIPTLYDTPMSRLVALHCQIINKNPEKEFDIRVAVEDSELGQIFEKMLTGQNDFGRKDDPISLVGMQFKFTNYGSHRYNYNYSLVLAIPFESSKIRRRIYELINDGYTQDAAKGDIFMGIRENGDLFLVIIPVDEVKVDENLNKVGYIEYIPAELITDTIYSFKILDCRI